MARLIIRNKPVMVEKSTFFELVRLAQLGDKESMDRLAQLSEGRIRAYINRVSLDEESSLDLTQETMLTMIESLGELEKAERFWPWIYRVAMSKIQQHRRLQSNRAKVKVFTLEDALLERCTQDEGGQGLGLLVRKELAALIVTAMSKLNPRQRAALSLRYFEEMAYAEIAEVLRCSELNARILFFRARKALQKHLSRRGFGKGALLLALGLFGNITAPAQAAGSATAIPAALAGKVGVTGSVLGWIGSRTGVTVTMLLTVLA